MRSVTTRNIFCLWRACDVRPPSNLSWWGQPHFSTP